MRLINNLPENSDIKAIDISSERKRKYYYPRIDGNDAYDITVYGPKMVYITPEGNHRVLDDSGWVSRIPPGWSVLSWLPGTDQPHVVA